MDANNKGLLYPIPTKDMRCTVRGGTTPEGRDGPTYQAGKQPANSSSTNRTTANNGRIPHVNSFRSGAPIGTRGQNFRRLPDHPPHIRWSHS